LTDFDPPLPGRPSGLRRGKPGGATHLQKNKSEIISEKGRFSEIFPIIRNFWTSFIPAFQKGRKMNLAEKWSS
jgi:uncharacterized protein (UPF0333 family)